MCMLLHVVCCMLLRTSSNFFSEFERSVQTSPQLQTSLKSHQSSTSIKGVQTGTHLLIEGILPIALSMAGLKMSSTMTCRGLISPRYINLFLMKTAVPLKLVPSSSCAQAAQPFYHLSPGQLALPNPPPSRQSRSLGQLYVKPGGKHLCFVRHWI